MAALDRANHSVYDQDRRKYRIAATDLHRFEGQSKEFIPSMCFCAHTFCLKVSVTSGSAVLGLSQGAASVLDLFIDCTLLEV